MNDRLRLACTAALLATTAAGPMAAMLAASAAAADPEWIRQFGSDKADQASGVAAAPDGRVSVVGTTSGTFSGASKGNPDTFIITFDRDGSELWRRQPGTSDIEYAKAVATDAGGNVIVVGQTFGALGGVRKQGEDAFVIRYDRDGHVLWKRQPGTTGYDYANGVATDVDGSVYVVGGTEGALAGASKGKTDAFVIKYDSQGHMVWKRQPGTSEDDYANAVATDADGTVTVVGQTFGALAGPHQGGYDAFVIKYDRDGHVLWRRQPATSRWEWATGVATDADGDVFVVGLTGGALAGAYQGNDDAFVIAYDRSGQLLWQDQRGGPGSDDAAGVATGSNGTVYVVGSTFAALGGPVKGHDDAFVIAYDHSGHVAWSDQPGTADWDGGTGVATDADGNVYVTGITNGAMPGYTHKDEEDSFLIRYGPDGPQ